MEALHGSLRQCQLQPANEQQIVKWYAGVSVSPLLLVPLSLVLRSRFPLHHPLRSQWLWHERAPSAMPVPVRGRAPATRFVSYTAETVRQLGTRTGSRAGSITVSSAHHLSSLSSLYLGASLTPKWRYAHSIRAPPSSSNINHTRGLQRSSDNTSTRNHNWIDEQLPTASTEFASQMDSLPVPAPSLSVSASPSPSFDDDSDIYTFTLPAPSAGHHPPIASSPHFSFDVSSLRLPSDTSSDAPFPTAASSCSSSASSSSSSSSSSTTTSSSSLAAQLSRLEAAADFLNLDPATTGRDGGSGGASAVSVRSSSQFNGSIRDRYWQLLNLSASAITISSPSDHASSSSSSAVVDSALSDLERVLASYCQYSSPPLEAFALMIEAYGHVAATTATTGRATVDDGFTPTATTTASPIGAATALASHPPVAAFTNTTAVSLSRQLQWVFDLMEQLQVWPGFSFYDPLIRPPLRTAYTEWQRQQQQRKQWQTRHGRTPPPPPLVLSTSSSSSSSQVAVDVRTQVAWNVFAGLQRQLNSWVHQCVTRNQQQQQRRPTHSSHVLPVPLTTEQREMLGRDWLAAGRDSGLFVTLAKSFLQHQQYSAVISLYDWLRQLQAMVERSASLKQQQQQQQQPPPSDLHHFLPIDRPFLSLVMRALVHYFTAPASSESSLNLSVSASSISPAVAPPVVLNRLPSSSLVLMPPLCSLSLTAAIQTLLTEVMTAVGLYGVEVVLGSSSRRGGNGERPPPQQPQQHAAIVQSEIVDLLSEMIQQLQTAQQRLHIVSKRHQWQQRAAAMAATKQPQPPPRQRAQQQLIQQMGNDPPSSDADRAVSAGARVTLLVQEFETVIQWLHAQLQSFPASSSSSGTVGAVTDVDVSSVAAVAPPLRSQPPQQLQVDPVATLRPQQLQQPQKLPRRRTPLSRELFFTNPPIRLPSPPVHVSNPSISSEALIKTPTSSANVDIAPTLIRVSTLPLSATEVPTTVRPSIRPPTTAAGARVASEEASPPLPRVQLKHRQQQRRQQPSPSLSAVARTSASSVSSTDKPPAAMQAIAAAPAPSYTGLTDAVDRQDPEEEEEQEGPMLHLSPLPPDMTAGTLRDLLRSVVGSETSRYVAGVGVKIGNKTGIPFGVVWLHPQPILQKTHSTAPSPDLAAAGPAAVSPPPWSVSEARAAARRIIAALEPLTVRRQLAPLLVPSKTAGVGQLYVREFVRPKHQRPKRQQGLSNPAGPSTAFHLQQSLPPRMVPQQETMAEQSLVHGTDAASPTAASLATPTA